MNFTTLFSLAMRALIRNKSRSLLTMLGVIIGVAAVIITVAIGAGARASVTQQIQGLGSNLLIVIPGSVTQTGARTGNGGASSLTPADGMAVAQLPGVAAVSPTVTVRTQVVAGGNNWQTTATGVSPAYGFVRSWPMQSGTMLTQSDVTSASKVTVLGSTVVTNLFPDGSNPIGQTILIRNVPFTVIGVLQSKGQSGLGQDQDDTALIPYTSALNRLTGGTTVNSLLISVTSADASDSVQASVTQLLEARHRIDPPQQDDFQIRNLQDIAAAASSTAAILELLLASVAAVSLVVGGIGIMNIMLVSVTERTREIGLRMAVGARSSAILRQFLVEAVVLSTAGGIIGVVAGTLATIGAAAIGHWQLIVDPSSIFIAVGFSAMVGIFFGYYPARRAAGLNPIDALRFE
ncbi:MAG TPA: ABC transporter permease [Candidatus Binatia bacterium]|nr:ABC transporter permease [Candidatus Binatia bacterium]